MNGSGYIFFERFHQIVCIIGGYQTGHILDADAICTHLLELFGFAYVVINIVNLATHALFCE
jgi:hypothetical protein